MKRLVCLAVAASIGITVVVRSQSAVDVQIDAAASRHTIDPRIYGMAYPDAKATADLRVPISRWGGNATTRYNWKANASNRASDWYFESLPSASSTAGADGDAFVSQAKTGGAEPQLTIPMIGWVAKLGANRGRLSSFSIAKYGAQTDADRSWFPDAGNGVLSATGQPVVGNNPNDANTPADAAFQRGWVEHLVGQFGTASGGGVRYYYLDNEPSLWHTTHRDVHPNGATMDEVLSATLAYGAEIKSVDPGALVLGPEEWGWSGYLYSGADLQWGQKNGWNNLPDRAAHGNWDFVPWYLDQLRQRNLGGGPRLLDVLSLHYYPQGGEFGADTSTAMQRLRNRSTRALWDPNYVNESWIGTPVELVPRMKRWISTYYPGTKTAITEYNWGAESHINGATAQADILGIFGREQLDMAARWGTPDAATPTYKAVKLYRNYDNQGSGFGDTSVSAVTPNPDLLSVFAAQRSSDQALTIMAINKDFSPVAANLRLANFVPGSTVQAWQLTSANVITRLADITAVGATLAATLPPQSLTMFVVPVASGGSSSLSPTAGTPQSVSVNTTFASALQATARDVSGNPLKGVTVTFTAPASGASARFGSALSASVTTDAAGVATAPALTAGATAGGYTVVASAPGIPSAAVFNLTNVAVSGGTIGATAGTPQSAKVNTTFATSLKATVLDASSKPVVGAKVTFTAPASGASARFGVGRAVAVATDASGVAIAPDLTANRMTGTYMVTATAPGAAVPASFSLTNLARKASAQDAADSPQLALEMAGEGVWQNVTPPGFTLDPNYPVAAANYGATAVLADAARPSDLYVGSNYQGILRSTDYGLTWTKISTGVNSDTVNNGRNWAVAIDPNPNRNPATPPTLYSTAGYSLLTDTRRLGVWKSTDGGVNWTSAWVKVVAKDGVTDITAQVSRDIAGISIDPNNGQHLLAQSHDWVGNPYGSSYFETTDGGGTWRDRGVPIDGSRTITQHYSINFLTSTTWAATGEGWGPDADGTFVTTNSGVTWTRVGSMGKGHHNQQPYMSPNGTAYLPAVDGIYKASAPYLSWTQLDGAPSAVVVGTPSYLYSSYGWATQGYQDPVLRRAGVTADAAWSGSYALTPGAMSNGMVGAAVTRNASGQYIVVSGNYLGGMWRYVESGSGPAVVSVAIQPKTVSLLTGAIQVFGCAVSGATDTSCNWSVMEAGGGSITTSGVYTAPATAGIYHVMATSRADATKSDTATVTVGAPAPTLKITAPSDGAVVQSTSVTVLYSQTNPSGNVVFKQWQVDSNSPVMDQASNGTFQFTNVPTGSHRLKGWLTDANMVKVAGTDTSVSVMVSPASTALSVMATVGTPQATLVNTAFPTALQATVRDSSSNPVGGVTVTFSAPGASPIGTLPQLTVVGNKFVDGTGNRVMLRGVSSQGMGMIYGDKANPGTYAPMTLTQYVDRAIQTDATGNQWYSNAIRLNFERFPSVNPQRLYSTENAPYAMPDTIAFSPWQASHAYGEGDVASSGGSRYRAVKKLWRADRGQPWNPTPYQMGEVVVNVNGDVYKCISSSGTGTPTGDWGAYPRGTGSSIPENQGALQYVWQYLGPFGMSGTTGPSQLTQVTDNGMKFLIDNRVQWQFMSMDYSAAQSLANFEDWKAKVMDPAIAQAIADKMYVVVTDFDFGPAHHPLRRARMLDFWSRMATSQWANHPNVIFELWNESEDIGTYAGGPGSWAAQKPAIQETVNAIRAAGANNIVIVPTPFYSAWAAEATASPLAGSNLAYAIHQYRSQYEAYSSNRDQLAQALASGQALVFTEWGDDTNPASANLAWPTTTNVGVPLRQMLEPSDGAVNPAAGWFAWSLSQYWSPGMFNDAALTQPNAFGAAARQWLFDKRADSQPIPTGGPSGASGAGAGFGTALMVTAVTNASGIATAPTLTANGLSGSYTVTANVANSSGPASFALTNNPAGSTSISATAGTPQSATTNAAFATALQATVRNGSGSPMSGVTVTFTAPSSGASAKFGSVMSATAVTNASGVAIAPSLTANGTTGSYVVTATAGGAASPANFSLTNTSAVAASVTATAGTPQSAVIGANFATSLQATVKNSAGAGVSGVTVTFTAPATDTSARFGSSLSATAVSNASGVATAPTLTASGAEGSYIVTATVAGVSAPANFSLANSSKASAVISATAGTPQTAVITARFATALQATVKNSAGAAVSGVTVTFIAPTGGATATFGVASSATALTNNRGVATAPALTANSTAGDYIVVASVAGSSAPANFMLANVAGPTSGVNVTSGTPQSTKVNTTFNTALQATVRDASGNTLRGVTVTFTAPGSGASARFGSAVSATAVTNLRGVATAPALTANGTAGSYAVIASVPGVPVSGRFDLTNTAAAATTVTMSADKTAPQVVGTSITFTATAAGGTAPYSYLFLLSDGVNSAPLNAWSTTNTLTWKPTTASSTYQIVVWARSATSSSTQVDATAAMAFPITTTTPITKKLAWDANVTGVDGFAVTINGVRTDYKLTPLGAGGVCGCSITWTSSTTSSVVTVGAYNSAGETTSAPLTVPGSSASSPMSVAIR